MSFFTLPQNYPQMWTKIKFSSKYINLFNLFELYDIYASISAFLVIYNNIYVKNKM